MRAYIALSYNYKEQLRSVISAVQSVLLSLGVDPFVFVYERDFSHEQSHKMMEDARKELDLADFIIIEGSHKAVGVGIEAGYMYALDKPIIYIHNKEAEYSTTIGGIASVDIDYSESSDIESPLRHTVAVLRKNRLDK